jgi:hypothetical protein
MFFGHRAKVIQRYVRGTKYSVLVAVGAEGIVCYAIYKGAVDATRYESFWVQHLLPKIAGTARVCMHDNLSAHLTPVSFTDID